MANTEETPVYKVALRIMWFHVIIFSPGDRTRKPPTLVSASPPPFHSHIY